MSGGGPEIGPPATGEEPTIIAHALTRTFGKVRAVDGLDLAVNAGEVYGFLGPNGAGKTTTIRILNGLLQPTSGTVRVLGRDVRDPETRRATGLVPDTAPLQEYLTGWEYAAFVTSLYGVPAAARDERIAALFEVFELTAARDEICKGYSFGMRKKLHIAAVLACAPQVLFLDEPTVGLDPRSARRLKDHLLALRQTGVTMFLTTHLLDLAQEICDRVGILANGRMLAEGPVTELTRLRGAAGLEQVFLEITEASTGDAPAAAG